MVYDVFNFVTTKIVSSFFELHEIRVLLYTRALPEIVKVHTEQEASFYDSPSIFPCNTIAMLLRYWLAWESTLHIWSR